MNNFDEKYIPVTESGCWIWVGGEFNNGYGWFSVNGKKKLAHRVSYELYIGNIPDQLHVLHRCDTPLCVNPDHLFVGTNADNMVDKKNKNRCSKLHGEDNPAAKLTYLQVEEIKKSRKTHASLALRYDVNESTIARARSGKTWSNV